MMKEMIFSPQIIVKATRVIEIPLRQGQTVYNLPDDPVLLKYKVYGVLSGYYVRTLGDKIGVYDFYLTLRNKEQEELIKDFHGRFMLNGVIVFEPQYIDTMKSFIYIPQSLVATIPNDTYSVQLTFLYWKEE